MELTEKLMIEFCQYCHNYNDYKYNGYRVDNSIFKVKICVIGGFTLFQYYFFHNDNCIQKIIKDDLLKYNVNEKVTNKWIKFLRKKKLDKLQNRTN